MARASFDKKSEWVKTCSCGVTFDPKAFNNWPGCGTDQRQCPQMVSLSLKEADARLIQFLARSAGKLSQPCNSRIQPIAVVTEDTTQRETPSEHSNPGLCDPLREGFAEVQSRHEDGYSASDFPEESQDGCQEVTQSGQGR